MNAPLQALSEMQRLTSPFPESITVKEWKAKQKKVVGWFNPYIPEEIIHAAGMLPIEVTGDNEVTFYFDVKNNRELPMIMGQLTILPKHWWTGKDASGNQRDPMKTTLEPPLGSGPYRIKEVKPGRSIVYERVKDYWGKDLPVNAGQWNYDTIRFEYYRDETVAFESFKAGNLDYWQETSAKNWATAYDFAAVRNGLVKRQEVAQRLHEAMEDGELIENAEYEAARERQGFIEGRILELEGKLANAQVIDPGLLDDDGRVVFGSTVDLMELASEESVTYQIVGEDEADIKLGKLSYSSPIAKALIGKFSGDVAEVRTPGGVKEFEIVDVRYV